MLSHLRTKGGRDAHSLPLSLLTSSLTGSASALHWQTYILIQVGSKWGGLIFLHFSLTAKLGKWGDGGRRRERERERERPPSLSSNVVVNVNVPGNSPMVVARLFVRVAWAPIYYRMRKGETDRDRDRREGRARGGREEQTHQVSESQENQ